MTWQLAGQIAVCWIVLSIATAPLIGRWLHNRRINQDFKRELKLIINREEMIAAVKRDLEDAKSYDEDDAFMLDDNDTPPNRAA